MYAGKNKLEKYILFLLALSIFSDLAYLGFSRLQAILFPVILVLPLIITLLHAVLLLGRKRAIFFIMLAFANGLVFEIIGVRFGSLLGAGYSYGNPFLAFEGVPLFIPAYWAVFIYGGYMLSNSFLVWSGRKKPNSREGTWAVLVMMIIMDGLLVTSLDLVMEPVSVIEGRWHWTSPGPYFGIPLQNFAGWFILSIFTSGVFRLFEYYLPAEAAADKKYYLLPAAGYFTFYVMYCILAMRYGLPGLALIGVFISMPVLILNLLLFLDCKE